MAFSDAQPETLRIGSRGSHLALWQANYVANRLNQLGVATTIEIIKTTGDNLQSASLVRAGGKGLFTKEIEDALLAGQIDLAVHSLKDLPTENPPGLTIAAIPEREDPRDALLGTPLGQLPRNARVGTSSNRRAAQLLVLRPDVEILPVRGNVDTRIRKLHEGQYDAILLAVAGLRRLGLDHEIAQIFSVQEICPPPGQGALAIQTRCGDPAAVLCASLNHAETSAAVQCERAVLAALGGGCLLPVAAYSQVENDQLHVMAGVFAIDGSASLRTEGSGVADEPFELGNRIGQELLSLGANEILRAPVP
jgi:hydroxymethylbilane synthase